MIYGWSLGGAVAVGLAAETEQAAVILEGAPASLVDIGQLRYPLFPIRLIMRNPFDAIRNVGRIRSPMLFLHAADDAVIPISEGRRLFDAASGDKTFVEVQGGHAAASEGDAAHFYGAIRQFLRAARPSVAARGEWRRALTAPVASGFSPAVSQPNGPAWPGNCRPEGRPYSTIVNFLSASSLIVRPRPGTSSRRSMEPSTGAGSPSKM